MAIQIPKISDIPEEERTPIVLSLLEVIHALKEEIQQLKDEIPRLKGQKTRELVIHDEKVIKPDQLS